MSAVSGLPRNPRPPDGLLRQEDPPTPTLTKRCPSDRDRMGILFAKALQEFHEAGVVHCDTKADSVPSSFSKDADHCIDLNHARRPAQSHSCTAPASEIS